MKRGATQRVNFTERRLAALPTPSKRAIIYDTAAQSLGLKCEPSGRKVWFWFRSIAGRPTWKTIGPHPDVSLEAARQKANEYNYKLAEWQKDGSSIGSNPFETHRGALTLGEMFEHYLARHIRSHAHHPEKAEYEIRSRINTHLASWMNRRVSDVRRKDVIELHATIGQTHKSQANRLLEDLRAAINWAIEAELWTGENPCSKIKAYHEASSTRFIQPDEMPKLFSAMKKETDRDIVDFVNLSLWCGARKMDILSMRWSDLSLDDHRWNVPDPKNRQSYQIALTPEAVEILKSRRNDSEFVFPARSACGHVVDIKKKWAALRERAGLKDLRMHDLRRTLGSWQATQGTSMLVIGRSLGHAAGSSATAVYSRLSLDSVRASVNQAAQSMILAGRKRLAR
jgi:integrase